MSALDAGHQGMRFRQTYSVALPLLPWPPPDREPERRRLELPDVPFFEPVPDAPGRLALFLATLEPVPDVFLVARGASVFEPLPAPTASRGWLGG
jgi:hypothetical protein